MSPTYTVEPRFWRDFNWLTHAQQTAFLQARDRVWVAARRDVRPLLAKDARRT